jgi:hypothetical protein
MLTLLINETKPLAGLFASTTGGIGSVPDISVADEGQAVSVQTFTRTAGVITDSFVAGDVLHIGIGDGVNAPVCYIELSSASPATGTMAVNTVGMVALFAATVADRLSLQVGVVRTRGGYTNTIFSAPIVIHRSVIDPDTAVPTPSILGTGVAAALLVAINTALGFVRLDASARLPAVDGSQLTNVPNELPSQTGNSGKYLTTNGTATSWATVTGGVTSITGTANEITVTGTTTPTLSLPSALTLTGKTVTGGTFNSGAFNGSVGATTPSTVAGTTGTFSGAVTGTTFNAVPLNRGLGDAVRNIALGDFALAVSTTGNSDIAIGRGAMASVTIGDDNVAVGSTALFNNISGNKNTAVGSQSLQAATGSGNVALGYNAGAYETGSNSLYIDNQDRTNTAGDKAKALLYGTFAATAAAQQLTINAGTITLNGSAVTAASYAGAGTGLTGTAASLTAGNVTTIPALSGAITNTGNATVLGSFTMAQLSTAVSDGDPAYVGAANTFTTGQTISSTTSLLLGTAGSAVGNVGFRNATSGTTTLAPAAGALGTGTVTLPLSGTLAISSGAQTFTGVQSMTSPDITTSITTPSATFAIANATATTLNIGGAATTVAVGASTGTCTIANATVTLTNCTALNISGGAAAITGGAGNMTITAGTGNSRTLTMRTTTNAGSAVDSLTLSTGSAGQTGAIVGTTSNKRMALNAGASGSGFEFDSAGGYVIQAASNANVGLGAGAVMLTIWGSNGNANIGTTFADSGFKLRVEGTLKITGAATLDSTLAVTGASTLTGLLTTNGGITLGDAQNIAFNTTTGTKIGAATTQKLSFWNATPIVQPTTAVASATVASPGGGSVIKTDDTFDGYTLAQVVKALRNAGLLA